MMQGPLGTQETYEYDNAGRVIAEQTVTDKKVTYEYDKSGLLTAKTNARGQKTLYSYHNIGNVTSVQNSEGITEYQYDANGNITKMTRPDGSVLTKKYDAAENLIEASDIRANGTIISKFAYSYDANGNIIQEISYGDNVRYDMTYDNMDRVISRQKTDLSTMTVLDMETFTYDDACNIISSSKQNSIVAMTYDIRNRLKTVSGLECIYDADGNMTTGLINGNMLNMKYDSSNRLISAGNTKYTYDAENTRIAKEDASGKTSYVYGIMGQSSILLETSDDDGKTVKYVYGAGALISQESSDGTSYYHYDLRGSTVALTNDAGTITDRYQYDVYGQVTHTEGESTTPFLYNGRDGVMTDGNGLLYMRARYYSPELKRFVNADVLMGNIGDSDTLNRYAYVEGNPVSMVDPFGLCAEPGSKKKGSRGFLGKVKSAINNGKKLVKSVKSVSKTYFSSLTVPDCIHTVLDGCGMILGEDLFLMELMRYII